MCWALAGNNSMAKTNPSQFVRQVRQEISKVTWPSRKEAGITTGMVFIFVMLATVFFVIVDQVMSFGVRFLLGLGS
jgi:preprotein translocase subunit SecE